MKVVAYLASGIVVLLIALLASVFIASESGEVVVFESTDDEGAGLTTRLWVVEHAGHQWLRAGNPDSAWLANIRSHGQVMLTRGDETRSYRAVPATDAATRNQINALILQKYPGADKYLQFLMLDRTQSIPVRLEPTNVP